MLRQGLLRRHVLAVCLVCALPDAVLIAAGVAAGFAGAASVAFGVGAAGASFLFFLGLGDGACLVAPLFAKPQPWRVLDTGVGAAMSALAAKLVAGCGPPEPAGVASSLIRPASRDDTAPSGSGAPSPVGTAWRRAPEKARSP